MRWLAVDWGTTHLRVWPDGQAEALRRSDQGMNALRPAQFGPTLRDLVSDLLPSSGQVPVIACGMVGAAQGWAEAPYIAVPAPPPSPKQARVMDDGDLRVHILPGLKQAAPADVMRGEETQIAGFLALHAEWDGVVCLPGTHTKWVHISAGEVVSFQTFMTGELFALLSEASVLRHSVGSGTDAQAFASAVAAALSKPAALTSSLFRLRAEGVLDGLAPSAARARLSGTLIGAELAAAKPYWLGQRVAVIGAGEMADGYAMALDAQGVPVERADAAQATLAGLRAAYEALV
ncbi:MAG: 2-dehydro-3-deoxygalactonokinase [Pseudomonadota bacterium]